MPVPYFVGSYVEVIGVLMQLSGDALHMSPTLIKVELLIP